MPDIAQAVESFASLFLGRYGIVSVADAYEDQGTAFLLVLTTNPDATKNADLPETHAGFAVVVRSTAPLGTYS